MINNNFKKVLIKFGLWLGMGFATMIIGISNAFADQVNVGTITNKTQVLLNIYNYGSPITLNAGSVNNAGQIEEIYIVIDNQEILANYTYMLELYTPNAKLSNVNSALVTTGSQSCQIIGLYGMNGEYPKVYFKCLNAISSSSSFTVTLYNNLGATSGITSANNFSWSYTYLRYWTDDNDIDLAPVIANQNQNTQNIINNQNQNTQDIIDSNKICNYIDKSSIIENNKYLNSVGSIVSASGNWGITDFIKLSNSSTIENLVSYSQASTTYYCFYNVNKTLISCSANSTLSENTLVSIPTNSSYVRFSIYSDLNKPTFNICQNGNQALDDSINNLNDSLNNSDVDDNGIASAFEDFDDYLDDNSTITQLITLPITLYTAILNNLNGSCSPFNLGELYGEDLILPCINVSQYLGSSLWSMIDIIISGFAIFAISKKMIKVFNNFSSLREGDVIDD